MTRRKPLSKRLTILSIASNLTQKQEHQLVAMADRARKMEAEIETLRGQVERVRGLADSYSRLHRTTTAARIFEALDGLSDFDRELIREMGKPLGTPAEQAALSLRTERAINQMGSDLRAQEEGR